MIQAKVDYLRACGQRERACFFEAKTDSILEGLRAPTAITEQGAGLGTSAVQSLRDRLQWEDADEKASVTTGWSLLMFAAISDNVGAVVEMVSSCAESTVNLALNNSWPDLCGLQAGDTPLHAAMAFASFDVVDTLLRAHADPYVTNVRGHAAFGMACVASHANVTKWLQKFPNWDLKARDPKFGITYLHLAAHLNPHSGATAETLLAARADVNEVSFLGRNSLQMLVSKEDSDPAGVRALLSAGADLQYHARPSTFKWKIGLAAVRTAWRLGNQSPIVEEFAQLEGCTALSCARAAGHVEILEILNEASRNVIQ